MQPVSAKNKLTLGCSNGCKAVSTSPEPQPTTGSWPFPEATPFSTMVGEGGPWDAAELEGMHEGGSPSLRSSSNPVEQTLGMRELLGGAGESETAALASQQTFPIKQGSRSST